MTDRRTDCKLRAHFCNNGPRKLPAFPAVSSPLLVASAVGVSCIRWLICSQADIFWPCCIDRTFEQPTRHLFGTSILPHRHFSLIDRRRRSHGRWCAYTGHRRRPRLVPVRSFGSGAKVDCGRIPWGIISLDRICLLTEPRRHNSGRGSGWQSNSSGELGIIGNGSNING